jgi:hypothetical protein
MTTKTFNRDLTGLPLLTTDGNGTILEVDGLRALVAFDGGDKRWCEESETIAWLLCDCDAYTPEPIVLDGVEAFKAYCKHVFDENPYLVNHGSYHRDAIGRMALENVC